MSNKRHKDKAHDIGDSMPGTPGHSEGTFHDRQQTQSFDPSEDNVMSEEEANNYIFGSSKSTGSENSLSPNSRNNATLKQGKNSPSDSSKSGKFAELEGESVEVTVDRISGSGNAIAQYQGYDVHVEDGKTGESYIVELDAYVGYFLGRTKMKE